LYFDRFDVASAWYLALSECHAGQYSRSYERLSRLTEYFKPGMMLSVDSLTDNGREIYEYATERLLTGYAR
jgi:hypothetical protein